MPGSQQSCLPALYMLEIGTLYDVNPGDGRAFSGMLIHTIANKLVLVFNQVNSDKGLVMHGKTPNQIKIFRASIQVYPFGDLVLSRARSAKLYMVAKNVELQLIDQIPPPSSYLHSVTSDNRRRNLQPTDTVPLPISHLHFADSDDRQRNLLPTDIIPPVPFIQPSSQLEPISYRVYIEMSTGDYLYKESAGSLADIYPTPPPTFAQKNETSENDSMWQTVNYDHWTPVPDSDYRPIFASPIFNKNGGKGRPGAIRAASVRKAARRGVRGRTCVKRKYWR
jgi:hypothetical protein